MQHAKTALPQVQEPGAVLQPQAHVATQQSSTAAGVQSATAAGSETASGHPDAVTSTVLASSAATKAAPEASSDGQTAPAGARDKERGAKARRAAAGSEVGVQMGQCRTCVTCMKLPAGCPQTDGQTVLMLYDL